MSQFSFLLDDYSPLLVYTPYANGQANQTANGWVQYFTGNGFNTAPGEDGQGDSFHITSLQGATVSLQFFGTDVTLFGTSNGTYSVSLDDDVQSPSSLASGQLFSTSGLSNANHNITLSLTDSSGDPTIQLAFDGANVTSTTQSDSGLQPLVIDNSNTSAVTYTGSWSTHTAHQIPEPYHFTNASGSSASLEFQGRAVAINGMSNFGWGIYRVILDGVPYNGSRNGSSMFINPNATLFFQDGLDETTSHTVNITNVFGDIILTITSFTVFASNDIHTEVQPTNTSPNSATTSIPTLKDTSRGSNSGAIAGAVIGALAFLALIAGLTFWYRRRRNTVETVAAYPREDMDEYFRPDVLENSAGMATLGHSNPPTYPVYRSGKGTLGVFSPLPVSDSLGSSYTDGRESSSSPSGLQVTESSNFAPPSWNPSGPPNARAHPLQAQQEPSSAFSNPGSGNLNVDVDRFANRITHLERRVNQLGIIVHDDHTPPPQYESNALTGPTL